MGSIKLAPQPAATPTQIEIISPNHQLQPKQKDNLNVSGVV
jgi:hypothetical protein